MIAVEGVVKSRPSRQLPEGSLAACTWSGEEASAVHTVLEQTGPCMSWQEAASKELLHCQSHRIQVKSNPVGEEKWVLAGLTLCPDWPQHPMGPGVCKGRKAERCRLQSLEGMVLKQL